MKMWKGKFSGGSGIVVLLGGLREGEKKRREKRREGTLITHTPNNLYYLFKSRDNERKKSVEFVSQLSPTQRDLGIASRWKGGREMGGRKNIVQWCAMGVRHARV